MKKLGKINVLGTPYTIISKKQDEDVLLTKLSGYCDSSVKKIVVEEFEKTDATLEDLDEVTRRVIRHELTHAFLFESGLGQETWAENEEMVDWIARQFPKMMEAFRKAKAL